MSEKIKVGIVGCGFVGGVLKTWIEENNAEECEVLVSDPPKGYNDAYFAINWHGTREFDGGVMYT